jgi:hypothetical protein
MTTGVPESGCKLVCFLEAYGLAHTKHQETLIFGDQVDMWTGDGLAVQILRDRQNWFVEVRPEHNPDADWCDVALLKEQITRSVGSDVLPFEYQAVYVVEHWEEMRTLITGPVCSQNISELNRRRNDRAARRYGFEDRRV